MMLGYAMLLMGLLLLLNGLWARQRVKERERERVFRRRYYDE